MTRRFLLVGLFVIFEPGGVVQIIGGTLVATIYLFIQRSCRPYADLADEFLAATTSFMMVLCFVCGIVFKYQKALEVQQDALSEAEKRLYLLDSNMLGYGLVISIFSTFFISGSVLAYALEGERRRRLRHEKVTKARHLRWRSNGQLMVLAPPVIPPCAPPPSEPTYAMGNVSRRFHVFLSHVWGTGQDQMVCT